MSNHSIRRINAILSNFGYTRYLEVGVSKGHTFMSVNAAAKTAVDPKFKFDCNLRANYSNERYCEITSDSFFIHDNVDLYDLIFLDGLHTFEQTYRDFCNATMALQEKGIIILDDTVPADIYSAHPVASVARQTRQKDSKHSAQKGGWHGDVYKVVFMVAFYHPSWSYATITDKGNPQTILWKKPRPIPGCVFSLEDISRLNYYDFLENIEFMNIVTDFDALISEIQKDQAVQ